MRIIIAIAIVLFSALLSCLSLGADVSSPLPKYVTYKKTVSQRVAELDKQISDLDKQLKFGQELKIALSLRRDEIKRVSDANQTMIFVVENDGLTTASVVDMRPRQVQLLDGETSVTALK